MLLALALTAAAQAATPPPLVRDAGFLRQPVAVVGCPPDALEHARNRSPVGPGGKLGELPDAHMILTVYKRDERGCPIIDIVQPNVSTRQDAEPTRARQASPPQRGRERQR
jgi:hypothetical protein